MSGVSDVVNRVGIPGADKEVESGCLGDGFEIYVDPADDPDITGASDF